MGLAQITNFTNFYNENLLKQSSLLQNNETINFVGDGTATLETINAYTSRSKSVKISEPFSSINNVNVAFDISDALEFVTPYSGIHIFQFSMMNQSSLPSSFNANIKLKVYIEDVPTYTFESIFNLADFGNGEFYTFAQSISASEGETLNFAFEVETTDAITATGLLNLYFSGFKCEFDNKGIEIPTPYSLPLGIGTLWQSRVDTTNTQLIPATTETNFGFTGTSSSNDTTSLISTTGLITPLYVNDVVSIDFYCDFVSTTSTDKFVDFLLKVDGVVYRAETYTLSKGIGETEYMSGSFKLPVQSEFKEFGAQLSIISSEAITIKNRYLNAVETINI